MRNNMIYLIFSLVMFAPAAQAFELCGDLKQGQILYIKNLHKKSIEINSQTYQANQDGELVFALKRDEGDFVVVDGHKLQVEKADWDIQSIKGVAQNKVTPAKTDEKEIERERQDVSRALTHTDYEIATWKEGFEKPIEGVVSGQFGNQRIFNGIKKNPHTGQDIAAAMDTAVYASAGGRVLLAGGNYFYSGNMVIIDHGYGLQTIYAHLNKAAVKLGDHVKKGELIGYVGKTGRATGPHLHWGASAHNVRFDPRSLLDLQNKKCLQLEDR